MKDSTKKLSKSLGTENAEQAVHLYLYGKYITHYLYHMAGPVGLVEKPPEQAIPPEVEEMVQMLARKVGVEALSAETSTYHGKILPLRNAEALVSVREDVELRDLEKVVPYRIARDIVLEQPLSIAVFECACRTLHEDPCRPLDVCMAVGEPIVSFLVEHGVLNARRVSVEEAVELLRAEHSRGHVHGAYFKDVVGGRLYAICNCCSCCCMGMKAWLKYGTPIIAHSGYTAKVLEECDACGECENICPFGAVTVEEIAAVDEDVCMGCGVCEGACPIGAIHLVPDSARGEPLDINRLVEERRAESPGSRDGGAAS